MTIPTAEVWDHTAVVAMNYTDYTFTSDWRVCMLVGIVIHVYTVQMFTQLIILCLKSCVNVSHSGSFFYKQIYYDIVTIPVCTNRVARVAYNIAAAMR